jgi:hypothetical protein
MSRESTTSLPIETPKRARTDEGAVRRGSEEKARRPLSRASARRIGSIPRVGERAGGTAMHVRSSYQSRS